MKVDIETVKNTAAKLVEKVTSSSKSSGGSPSLELVNSFEKDITKLSFVGMFYLYKATIRVVTLWTIYSWINGLM
jgi:hypothetical protein